jgi:hypothetical protein
MPINVLASEQSNATEMTADKDATEMTADKAIKLLNYCNTYPEAKIQHHVS